MTIRLVWLRNDLRITDNKALHAACSDLEAKVLVAFIATPKQWQKHGMSPRQATFIYENLLQVQQALAERGITLTYHQCDDFDQSVIWLQNYCHHEKVDELFYNRQYELNERERDQKLERYLEKRVVCKSFDDSVMLPPGSVLNNNLQMYKVYTPFRKAFIQHLKKADLSSLPAPKIRHSGSISRGKIPHPFDYPYQEVPEIFPSHEKSAVQRLRVFCKETVQYYFKQRDIPAIKGTSSLSPYLAIGVISPRQCFNRLHSEYPNLLERIDSGAFHWLNELIWREFYRHLIVAYPFLCMGKPFINWTDKVCWNDNNQTLEAWKKGCTGYPIVDAAMRQLNAIGWMHNRLRMISASFLSKDLLINWRIGEQYFMSQLLDGDLAANNGGWQWAASTGCDAVPYFRIFNPTTQGKRFDPQGTFIRQWLPELKDVPDHYIHNPHAWVEENRHTLDYPLPITDHKQACQKTLAAFNAAKIGE
ncbi:deoxyribodipyrimidine photo-lyase [Candidatus Liberibacter sp.]|uniref:deoxyribodipyrimidine photo-lyase n=1 Tax=Candidatus Liberibacter sp. TaxID=34022 RepID=UPI0015F54B7D|nr:deoxyribodipyrimidine photo-lyase [Candidatus Liberibacter sp.]MBA5724066.1 deoxyribodipyrimidine photo-lyase [Candidatus Liberibacter sp.]